MNHLTDIGLTAVIWCAAHSLFVTHAWRDRLKQAFPGHHGLFRLVYVLFSSVSLGLLMMWWRGQPARLLWDWPGAWAVVRWAGLASALLLFWFGARVFDGRGFLGLRQAADILAGRPSTDPPFQATGILRHIRHPWYSGTILVLVCGLPVTDVNLVWRGVFIFYTIIGTELEERKLGRDLPEVYGDYRRRVGRFWPRFTRRRRRSP